MNRRIYSLDIIRGIAAVFVFLTHLGNGVQDGSVLNSFIDSFLCFQRYFLWCNGGVHWAVIVFVVLSGFCIHMPVASRESTVILMPCYVRKRFFRVFPVLFFATCIGYLSHYLVNKWPIELYFLNLIGNLSFLSGVTSYFNPPLGNEILLTVIVECILYAIYPYCRPRRKVGWLFILMSALVVHLVNFSLILVGNIDPTWVGRNVFSFLLYWWIGAFFAEVTFNEEQWRIGILGGCAFVRKAFVVIIMYLMYVVVSNLVKIKGFHVFSSLYLSFMAGVIISAAVGCEIRRASIGGIHGCVIRFMKQIGEYSYSLYVIHVPIISILTHAVLNSQIRYESIFYFLKIIVVSICTVLFYNFIEKPFHEYARISSDKALRRMRFPLKS